MIPRREFLKCLGVEAAILIVTPKIIFDIGARTYKYESENTKLSIRTLEIFYNRIRYGIPPNSNRIIQWTNL